MDGNGTIDFEEFKAGAKREPLLVKAFLAPVQQGSLATAPAAARKATIAGAGASGGSSASAVSSSEPAQQMPGASVGLSETATNSPEPVVESEKGTTTTTSVTFSTANPNECSSGLPDTPKTTPSGGQAAVAPPVAIEAESTDAAASTIDGSRACDGGVDGCDGGGRADCLEEGGTATVRAKRCRVDGLDSV